MQAASIGGRLFVVGVMLGAVLGCFAVMMLGLKMAPVSDMGVVMALGVVAVFVSLGCFFVMMFGMPVMFGGLAVVFRQSRVAHGCFLQKYAQSTLRELMVPFVCCIMMNPQRPRNCSQRAPFTGRPSRWSLEPDDARPY
jgi:hypothetical protein